MPYETHGRTRQKSRTRSALVAADGVVVPLQAEDYGAQGLKAILCSPEFLYREEKGDALEKDDMKQKK